LASAGHAKQRVTDEQYSVRQYATYQVSEKVIQHPLKEIIRHGST
jgi:hypothetical protein